MLPLCASLNFPDYVCQSIAAIHAAVSVPRCTTPERKLILWLSSLSCRQTTNVLCRVLLELAQTNLAAKLYLPPAVCEDERLLRKRFLCDETSFQRVRFWFGVVAMYIGAVRERRGAERQGA